MNKIVKIPTKVYIKITDSTGNIVTGVPVYLKFVTDYKNDFGYILTVKNIKNEIFELTKEEIIESANKDANFFLMDYGSIEHCFTSKIQVSLQTVSNIQNAIKGYEFWGGVNSKLFHPTYIDDLRYHLEKTCEMERLGLVDNLTIECWSEPEGIVTFEILPS